MAALNYLNILVTGRDLTGKRRPRMTAQGRKHCFIVIPILNVDGRERALDHLHWIGCNPEYLGMISQGVLKTGEILKWPSAKLIHPIPLDKVERLGTYYNDAGVNLAYDTPLAGDSQPETTALIRYCRTLLTDLVILSHSDNGSLVQAPSAFIHEHVKQRIDRIAAVVGNRCAVQGLPKHRIPQSPHSYAGDQFYQSDAIYHASGAVPLLVEFPCGWQNVPDSHEDILEIGLTVLDEIAAFGNRYRFRPRFPAQ